jgi:DNA-binding MarR family transcriptional regulator
MLVNIALVSLGSPDSRTTRTASATTSATLSVPVPAGAMLKAKSMGPACPSGGGARDPGRGYRPGTAIACAAGPVGAALLASPVMAPRDPLPFDPIMRAAALWGERIGPAGTMAAVTSVMRVQQILLSAVDGALRPHGLTFARYEALVLLSFSRAGRLPMRVMGERLQLHPTSVTNIVDRLQADGLVRRTPHPTDRRATLVGITDTGSALLEDATKSVTDIDFGLGGLSPEQETQLTDLLGKVRRAAGDFD